MADGGSKGSTALPRVEINGSRPDLSAPTMVPPVDSPLLFHGHQWRRSLSSSNVRSECSVPQPVSERRKITLARERSCLVDFEGKELHIYLDKEMKPERIRFSTEPSPMQTTRGSSCQSPRRCFRAAAAAATETAMTTIAGEAQKKFPQLDQGKHH